MRTLEATAEVEEVIFRVKPRCQACGDVLVEGTTATEFDFHGKRPREYACLGCAVEYHQAVTPLGATSRDVTVRYKR